MTADPLVGKFSAAMQEIYRRAKSEAGYNATCFPAHAPDTVADEPVVGVVRRRTNRVSRCDQRGAASLLGVIANQVPCD